MLTNKLEGLIKILIINKIFVSAIEHHNLKQEI